MMRRVIIVNIGSMLILLLLTVGSLAAVTERPLTLSMCAVSDYTSNKRFDATSALRFRITSV
jgi:hypothetical protein